MKSILQFMYLGQSTFYQNRMKEYLNVAKSQEIKEISKENNENNQRDNEISKKDKSTTNESYDLDKIEQTEHSGPELVPKKINSSEE